MKMNQNLKLSHSKSAPALFAISKNTPLNASQRCEIDTFPTSQDTFSPHSGSSTNRLLSIFSNDNYLADDEDEEYHYSTPGEDDCGLTHPAGLPALPKISCKAYRISKNLQTHRGSEHGVIIDQSYSNEIFLNSTLGETENREDQYLLGGGRRKLSPLRAMMPFVVVLMLCCFAFLIAFSFQSLVEVQAKDILIRTRSISLFEFDIVFQGVNPNIVTLTLHHTALDVLASRRLDVFPLSSGDIQQYQGDLFPENTAPSRRPIQELLGHVRSFNETDNSTFPYLFSGKISPRVSIFEPSNTLGRFIYMTFPFSIMVRGKVYYHSPFNLYQHFIPVCLYQKIYRQNFTQTFSCLS